jgi:hypothetical protein
MTYYITTAQGETGPFTVEKLNRMFQKGEIRGEQLCRVEDSQQQRRLDEVFKHFAPSQAVALKARRDVAAHNVSSGGGSVSLGGALVAGALFAMIGLQRISAWKIGAIIAGIWLIMNGMKQQKQGLDAQKKMKPASGEDEPSAENGSLPHEKSNGAQSAGNSGNYNY